MVNEIEQKKFVVEEIRNGSVDHNQIVNMPLSSAVETSEILKNLSHQTHGDPLPTKGTSSKVRTLIISGLVFFTYGASISLHAPLFPREAQKKGATPSEYGLVMGIYQLTICLTAILIGKLIGINSPKFIFTSGIFMFGTCYLLFGTLDMSPSGIPFIASAFAVRIVEGIGASSLKTSGFAIAASQFKGHSGKSFASMDTFLCLGLLLGPTAGGALYDIAGFSWPFYVMGTVLLCDGLIVCFLFPECQQLKRPAKGSMLKFWTNPEIFVFPLLILTTFFYAGFVQVNLEPHLRQFKLSGAFMGMIFAIPGFFQSMSSIFHGWLLDKGINTVIVSVTGCLLLSTSILLIGPAPFFDIEPTLGLIIAAQLLRGLGDGATLISSFNGALRNTIKKGFPNDVATHGLVSSMYSVSLAAGGFIGPSLGGYLYETMGLRTSSMVLFLVQMAMIFLLVIYGIIQARKSRTVSYFNEEKKPLIEKNGSCS